MRNLSKKLFGFSLILFIVGVCGMVWLFLRQENFAYSLKPIKEERVMEQEIKAIDLKSDTADIAIIPSKLPKATVRMVGEVSEQQYEILEFKSEIAPDGTLVVVLRERLHVNMFYQRNGEIKLEVELPEKVYENLQIETMSGDIRSGKLSAKYAKVISSTGDVEVAGYEGQELDVRTDTGDINLTDIRSAVLIDSSTGAIDKLTMPELTDHVSIRTDTGDIRVDIGKQPTAATLEVQTDTGGIETTWQNLSYERKEDTLVNASIGTGGPTMSVRSSTGDVRIQ
ncbi:DUF4097 family beta strand repeat-containing protein [Brevibacillus sp. 179-C9.3 HS]|uniref:DUF4097 family beta strand repeat-containing protein n=1 Tax=unclassified Brevibacillus TaxID=2684853 RepID=UPI0039A358FD